MKRSRSWKALATAGTAACLAFGGASAAWADQAAVALSAGSPFPESLTATADGTLAVRLSPEALRRGLAGWVRNRRDSTVEAAFSGPADAVAAMLEAARQGPPAGRVERIDQREGDAADLALARPGERFSVLPTA